MKIGMVIAHQNFRDEEFFEPARIFLDKGIDVVTISTDKSHPAKGKLGGRTEVDLLLADVNISDFDAVLFIGGPGARGYVEDEIAHEVARKTFASGKLLGAICMAPLILSQAGLLDGKNATVFPSDADELSSRGAIYSPESIVVDGLIVTADGPLSARLFAEKVLEMLKV